MSAIAETAARPIHGPAEQADEFCFRRLREIRASEGSVSREQVRQIAATVGRSERTVWRRINREACRQRSGYQLTERARELYYTCHGNVSAIWRRLNDEQMTPPSRPTLYRAFMTQMTPAERAYAVHGEKGWRAHQVYVQQRSLHRNAIWEADHKELSVEIIPPHGKKPVKPWVTIFIDHHTRAVMGWSINLSQTQADVIGALRSGIRPDAERGPFCGVPDNLVWDNGREFLGNAVTTVCRQLRTFPRPTKPFMPHHKGRIERFNRTLEQSFLSQLPGWVHGGENAAGKLYGGEHRLHFDDFTQRFEEFIYEYNHTKPHRGHGLDGRTPLQVWNEDPTALRIIENEDLRWMTLPTAERKVTTSGVSIRGVGFAAPQLTGLVGERVTVRYMPHDLRGIEIWRDNRFFCDAYPQGTLTVEDQSRFVAARRESKKVAASTREAAGRRMRSRQEPTTKGGRTPAEVNVVTYTDARKDQGLRTDPRTSGAGSFDLFDLTDLNQPIADEEQPDNHHTKDTR